MSNIIFTGTYITPEGTEYKLGNLKIRDNHIIGLLDNNKPGYYIRIDDDNIYIEKVIYEKVGEFDKLITFLDYIINQKDKVEEK